MLSPFVFFWRGDKRFFFERFPVFEACHNGVITGFLFSLRSVVYKWLCFPSTISRCGGGREVAGGGGGGGTLRGGPAGAAASIAAAAGAQPAMGNGDENGGEGTVKD